ncbi:YegS/Rv2252/BmrU family lipid kinase [Salegentibacter sp. F188]|uniref:YegS/Rv2252/BmrU family lipid kinase n=1 Tax=Autumnicola patrickiae TaxID=3075591 RepID=A0ABU3E6I9_9FLAO|nr:YegS/Rv2252/BmrU family lipid kinase [Salegentibacter sp. F188]MDT0691612.1 YegS/Rv2252/BmrU family lipid kinase [Salegentibacter sp. F188]
MNKFMKGIKEILLVVNPISGDIDKKAMVEDFKAIAAKSNTEVFLYHTKGEKDIENVRRITSEREPFRIIAAGGDGTIKMVAEAVKELNIPLGIIPSGSANALALNLNLPKNLEEQIGVALGKHFLDVDLISINDELGLHMSDIGINAELIKNYESSSFRGKFGYLLQTIPTLIQSKYPFKFKVETDKNIIEEEGVLLAIANASKYGTGAKVNPQGKLDDGVFEILIFKNLDLLEIMKTLRNEMSLSPDFIKILKVKKAKITCTEPVAFQVDGEYLGEVRELNVKLLPEKAKIAIP